MHPKDRFLFPDPSDFSQEFTEYLVAWRAGDAEARDRLFALIYCELAHKAHFQLKDQYRPPSLATLDLANEMVARLLKEDPKWENREQFMHYATRAMRNFLIDRARKYKGKVRAEGEVPEAAEAEQERKITRMLTLDRSLQALGGEDPRKQVIANMKLLLGMRSREIAECLGLAENTVHNQWSECKRFIAKHMHPVALGGENAGRHLGRRPASG